MRNFQKIWLMLIGLWLSLHINGTVVCAADTYEVSTATAAVEKLSETQYVIPLYISGNKGIMGFRLYLNYDADNLRMDAITKGLVTDGGTFGSDLSAESAYCTSVLWNDVSNITKDGSLMYLTVSILNESTKRIDIDVQYSQEDTFDEKYKDVILDCKPIAVDISGDNDGSAVNETLKQLIENEEEKIYLEEAKEVLSGANDLRTVDAAKLKNTVIKVMQQYGIRSLADVSEEQEEEFCDAVKKEMLASGAAKKSQLKNLNYAELSEQLVITEDDYYNVVFGDVEMEEENSGIGKSSKMIIVISISAAVLLLLIGIIVIMRRRKRNEK